MNVRDFAGAVSDLMWGSALGWDRPNGLQDLFDEVKGSFEYREKQVKSLIAENEQLKSENSKLQERIRNQKARMKKNPGAMLSAIADIITGPLTCGHPVDCWDEELEECTVCLLIKERDGVRRVLKEIKRTGKVPK